MTKRNGKGWALGTIAAAVAGYVAGILTAPKSGKETREDVKEAAKKSVATVEQELKTLRADLLKAVNEARNVGTKLKGEAKKQFDNATEFARSAAAKAKRALGDSGDNKMSDADLKNAVEEAAQALRDLKAFLKK